MGPDSRDCFTQRGGDENDIVIFLWFLGDSGEVLQKKVFYFI